MSRKLVGTKRGGPQTERPASHTQGKHSAPAVCEWELGLRTSTRQKANDLSPESSTRVGTRLDRRTDRMCMYVLYYIKTLCEPQALPPLPICRPKHATKACNPTPRFHIIGGSQKYLKSPKELNQPKTQKQENKPLKGRVSFRALLQEM